VSFKVYGLFTVFGEQNTWKDYSTCSCLGYIISAFDTTTGLVSVNNPTGTQTTVGDLKPQTLLQLKIVATSNYSRVSTGVIEDAFYLKMRQSPCVDNQLTFSPTPSSQFLNHYGTGIPPPPNIPNFSYLIGTSAQPVDLKYSTIFTNVECPLTATLYIYDQPSNSWVDKSVTKADWISVFEPTKTATQIAGFMTIYQAETLPVFVPEVTHKVKIKVQDLLSMDPNASAIEAIFTV